MSFHTSSNQESQTIGQYPWRHLSLKARDVNPIDSMICEDESLYLHWLARDYYQGVGEIVDGGPLFGGSTYALASGVSTNPHVARKEGRIHSYDLFQYFPDFARFLPGSTLKLGDSLLPVFKENTRLYQKLIEVHPGDILKWQWTRQPIELLFIDLSKSWQINNHIIHEFFGSLIPKRSIVIQQDYFHYYCYWLHLTMEYLQPYFEIIHNPDGATLSFLLVKEIPRELLSIDFKKHFTKEQAIELMDQAVARVKGVQKLYLLTAKMRMMCEFQDYKQARDLSSEIRLSPTWQGLVLYDLVQAESAIPAEILFPGLRGKRNLAAFSRNYNIFLYADWFYAVPYSQRGFDINSDQDRLASTVLKAKTLEEIGRAIQEVIQPKPEPASKLIGHYRQHSLVEFDNIIYALPQALGHIDLSNESVRENSGFISAETIAEVQQQIIGEPAPLLPVSLQPVETVSKPKATFSLLLPTRNNMKGINQLFNSLVETTDRLEELEIVLAVDDDDFESQAIEHELINLKKIIMPHGASMGSLNTACFEMSSGRYIMLINDDIIVRSKSWDSHIRNVLLNYMDDIVLIHVNDLLFREKLCTFPMLSRRACEQIGVCPTEYQRYRIDDHIYDTYSLLAYLGHPRIVYLPDVIFEHENHIAQAGSEVAHTFKSIDNKTYLPNQEIIQKDAAFFDSTLEKRKEDAANLAQQIDTYHQDTSQARAVQLAKSRQLPSQNHYHDRLAPIHDSFSYRRAEFVQQHSASEHPRVTIAVVTANLQNAHAVECIRRIKQHTKNYDLLILDNASQPNFNHPREMNKILRMVETSFVVLMDDDVFVEAGWLEGLFKGLDHETALIAPLHRNRHGNLSFSGVYFSGDNQGNHAHLLDQPARPRATQTICSAIILIDLQKCAGLWMDESYAKYFLDLDYSLQVWEAGYKVVVTPEVIVTHLGGATLTHGSNQANDVQERDRQHFINQWIRRGRLAKVENTYWRTYSELRPLTDIPRQIASVFAGPLSERFTGELDSLVELTKPYPQFSKLLEAHLEHYIEDPSLQVNFNFVVTSKNGLRTVRAHLYDESAGGGSRLRDLRYYISTAWHLLRTNPRLLISKGKIWLKRRGYAEYPRLVQAGYRGFNVAHYRWWYYGLSLNLGEFQIDSASPDSVEVNRHRGLIVIAPTLKLAKLQIWLSSQRIRLFNLVGIVGEELSMPMLIQKHYRGYNIVLYRSRFYALALKLGPVALEKLAEEELQNYQQTSQIICGQSILEIGLRLFLLQVTTIRQSANTGLGASMLIQEHYHGYNIVKYKVGYYGLALTLGPLSLESQSDAEISSYEPFLIVKGHSVVSVKARIIGHRIRAKLSTRLSGQNE